MQDIKALFETVVQQIKNLQSETDVAPSDPPSFPGLIATGQGGSILTNIQMERAITAVADWYLEQNPRFKSTHRLKEWRGAIRAAFGPALMQIDLDDPIEQSATTVRTYLDHQVENSLFQPNSLEMSFGCRLIEPPATDIFQVGPVKIEPADSWLTRLVAQNSASKTSVARIRRKRSGQRPRPRKSSMDAVHERVIDSTIAGYPSVISVTVEGLATQLAQERAIIGARLALTSIALLWEQPSNALKGFRLSVDHGHRRVEILTSVPNRRYFSSSQLIGLPFGPSLQADEWLTIRNQAKPHFKEAGSLIQCWTSVAAYNEASSTRRAMSQALYFFWQGAQDENDLMAIVKFTAALEALAGGKESAILTLLTRQLGINPDTTFFRGLTLNQALKRIYGHCRSRTLHGTNPDIAHDWSEYRLLAERLTRHALLNSIATAR